MKADVVRAFIVLNLSLTAQEFSENDGIYILELNI
jgi:hypothetical protein